jgi:hypothetical protein
MLSGQVADGLMTILAGEMVPHESQLYQIVYLKCWTVTNPF